MRRSVSLLLRSFRIDFSHASISSSSSSSSSTRFTPTIERKLSEMKLQHQALAKRLEASDISVQEVTSISKQYSNLDKSVSLILSRDSLLKTISDLRNIIDTEKSKGNADNDDELICMAMEESEECESRLSQLESSIMSALTPKDEADDRGIILEVRAGTGGDEASLFASEIFRMYQKYSILRGWRWEELSLSRTDIGGFKEAQASVTAADGPGVFGRLKHESGVHRVQRIPINSKVIQTSAASVIVMPEAEDIDVEIRPSDLRIDVFRAGGPGGQSVNKTESAVRITHIPTGLTVSMQDERSQIQNRAKAMKIIRSRVYDMERRRQSASRSELREALGGTGDRSDKIRTYNFPQDRVSDHRIGLTSSGVDRVMSGESLDDIVQALVEEEEKKRLEDFLKNMTRTMID